MKSLQTAGIGILFIFSTGTIAYAQNGAWLNSIAIGLLGVIPTLIALLTAFAVLYFVWGLVVFISQSGNEQARESGKNMMVWGVLALFVFVSAWGFVVLLQQIVGINAGNTPPAPQTKYNS